MLFFYHCHGKNIMVLAALGKGKTHSLRLGIISLILSFLSPALAVAASTNSSSLEKYEQCSWLVTYRGRTYDLAPLTREVLARPLEGDIRALMNRVPAAAEHLSLVNRNTKAAKTQAILASAALGFFVGTRIGRANAKDKDEEMRRGWDIGSIVSGLFFLKGIHASFAATSAAKEELAEAVEAFNAASPYPIQPVVKGAP